MPEIPRAGYVPLQPREAPGADPGASSMAVEAQGRAAGGLGQAAAHGVALARHEAQINGELEGDRLAAEGLQEYQDATDKILQDPTVPPEQIMPLANQAAKQITDAKVKAAQQIGGFGGDYAAKAVGGKLGLYIARHAAEKIHTERNKRVREDFETRWTANQDSSLKAVEDRILTPAEFQSQLDTGLKQAGQFMGPDKVAAYRKQYQQGLVLSQYSKRINADPAEFLLDLPSSGLDSKTQDLLTGEAEKRLGGLTKAADYRAKIEDRANDKVSLDLYNNYFQRLRPQDSSPASLLEEASQPDNVRALGKRYDDLYKYLQEEKVRRMKGEQVTDSAIDDKVAQAVFSGRVHSPAQLSGQFPDGLSRADRHHWEDKIFEQQNKVQDRAYAEQLRVRTEGQHTVNKYTTFTMNWDNVQNVTQAEADREYRQRVTELGPTPRLSDIDKVAEEIGLKYQARLSSRVFLDTQDQLKVYGFNDMPAAEQALKKLDPASDAYKSLATKLYYLQLRLKAIQDMAAQAGGATAAPPKTTDRFSKGEK